MNLNQSTLSSGRAARALRALQTLLLFFLVMAPLSAHAATLTVTNANNGGAGSLRQTISNAVGGDTINFDAAVFSTPRTINLTTTANGDGGLAGLVINKTLTIVGPGARLLTVRRNVAPDFAVIAINRDIGTVRLSGMTISNGGAVFFGAGLTNFGSTVFLDGLTISDTAQGADAAVDNNAGTMTMTNCLISNNATVGLLVENGTASVSNTTVSGNNDTTNGLGGVAALGGTLNLNNFTATDNQPFGANKNTGVINVRNTIIAGNQADINGSFASQGYNLIGNTTGGTGFTATGDKRNVAANLGALANNGGPTDTHAPNTGSAAINAGDPNFNGTGQFDQRGTPFARVFGTRLDIGAFEVQPPNTPPNFPASSYTAGLNDPLSIQLTATDPDGDTLTYSSANVPAGLSLSPAGLLTGTPAASGNFLFQVTVNDGRGGTATANIFIAVRNVAKGTDTLGPILTHNTLPKTLTRAELAAFTVTGTVRDVAPGAITPAGVFRVLVNLRTGDNKQAYNGSAFTTNLNRGYYIATQSAGTGDPRATLTYSRALSFVPTNLPAGPYILVLYPQDLAGNYSAEFLQFTVTAPAAPTQSPDVNSGSAS